MRHFKTLVLLIATAAPAFAAMPDFNAPAPIQHVQDLRVAERGNVPYAMTYTDEAAQSLGVKDGAWQAFQPSDPMMPALRGDFESGSAMLKLQWR